MSYQPQVKDVDEWAKELERLHTRIASHFARAEPRKRALAYLQGLLSSVERKNGWQLAEEAGEATPDGMQRLLNTAHWNADVVRDDLIGYVKEYLADPEAILVVDETGFLKKGKKSAGVKNQYSGTAGRKENCQVGVFLAYSTRQGHVLVDRELYLPQDWIDDRARCREAHIPDEVSFATKPQQALRMLKRCRVTGLPAQWVTGDTVYGGCGPLRHWLQEQRQAYVLALACNDGVDIVSNGVVYRHVPIKDFVHNVITEWHRESAGSGTKGERWFDWALIPLAPSGVTGWDHWLLVRRHIQDKTEWSYYLVFAPRATTFSTMLQVAGRRWRVEESLELGKGEVGLDQYEVRTFVGWYRHITLAMLALAYLVVVRSRLGTESEKGGSSIPLSCL
ncbi:MAG: IS701 family transposase [Ktedonobacteraceae bacterium]|nr:IS701 family transposase [Ktedonobacteraceae bacterium]